MLKYVDPGMYSVWNVHRQTLDVDLSGGAEISGRTALIA